MENNELLQVRSDRLFHDLFNENEMNTIEWTTMQILNCSYENIHGKVRVGNIRLNNNNMKEKNKYVDLIIEYDNETIIIELNNNYDGNYMRNLLYAFNSITSNYNIGISQYQIKKKEIKVILVNLNWHRYRSKLEGKEEIIVPYPSEKINDYLLKIININLDYYESVCYNNLDYRDKLWKLLTVKDKKELELLIENERLLEDYQSRLVNLSCDNKYKECMMNENIERNVERQAAYENGLYQGKEEKQKEMEQKQKEMVINLYKEKVPKEIICKCSGLTMEEIKEIVKDK